MPRYFFHVHDGSDEIDGVGLELADLQAAQRAGLRAAGEALCEGTKAGIWAGDEWRMFVTDQAGEEVYTLRFSAVMPSL